jgi:peptide/nickel transport system permease protein
MIQYIIRRLLYFIPTLIAVSLLAFIISVNAPGDPVDRMLSVTNGEGQGSQDYNQEQQAKYWRKKLGLDLPLFYFSVTPLSEPAFVHSLYDNREVSSLQQLSRWSGNSEATEAFHNARIALIQLFKSGESGLTDSVANKMSFDLTGLKYAGTIAEATARLESLQLEVKTNHGLSIASNAIVFVTQKLEALQASQTYWKTFIPVISFHKSNQYHRWIFGDGNWLTGKNSVFSKGIVRGDFGISYQTRQPVAEVISEKFYWSLFFSMMSVLLAYLISIPLGVYAGATKNSAFDKGTSLLLFILYSMPSFWVATLLLMTFANPDIFSWFPASGIKPVGGYPDGSSLLSRIQLSLPYIILPLICYTYSSFAFLSRTMRISVVEAMNEDYIRTAKAKGLPFRLVVFRHALRNSLLPLITVFANIFPLAIGGSVILETIFTIPGMGYETVQSIQNQNYPMIVAVFTITGFLTMLGYLVADILYAAADPRITLTTKR